VKANDGDVDNPNAQLRVSNATLADPTEGTVSVNPDGTITFTPSNNYSGAVTITYTLTDPAGLSDTATLTVNVGANTPPTGGDFTLTTAEDTPVAINTANFGFADSDAGQTFNAVRIDTLPAAGSLLLNGVAVTAGAVVPASEITAGHLVFVPAANAFLARLTSPINDLRAITAKQQSYGPDWLYAWNPLEATPLVGVDRPGYCRLVCGHGTPCVSRCFWRGSSPSSKTN